MSLNKNQLFYVLIYNSAKEIRDTFEMIYEVFQSIEQEGKNTQGEEVETPDGYVFLSDGI